MTQVETIQKEPTAENCQTFRFRKPETIRTNKIITQLCESDIIRGRVQVVRKGGENNLHTHYGMDGLWMVLEGKVKFYGPEDRLLGEFSRLEGIMIPRGDHYWFESSDPNEDLVLLQVIAFATGPDGKRVDDRRIDSSPRKALNPEEVPIENITTKVNA